MGSEKKISDEAVRNATGRGWTDWTRLLDEWGAPRKGHAATARHLAERHGLSPWWSQTVTVRYELDRGLRVEGQRGNRFALSVTRTVGADRARAFDAFLDPKNQSIWFTTTAKADLRIGGRYENADGDTGQFLVIDRPIRVRFTWENPKHCPGTRVTVDFAESGPNRTQVRLTHAKLASADDREKMKQGWSWAMDSYRSYVETGRPITEAEWERRKKERGRASGS
ncbi:MAG: hypothetical protein GF346_05700 [Candidatus Eisenbacteria bacterium]|nr:hypothetical protein [Candidatus Latescibacterota bacterium]MBD3301922.1 hypothetical protein [Candidatus Eisenbacteria bacterium]